jgi:hypothetical protein
VRLAVPEKVGTLAASPVVRECGDLHQGDIVELEYQLTNQSAQTTFIRHIQESCSCAKVDLRKKELLPGESTALRVRWDVGKGRGRIAQDLAIVFAYGSGPNEWASVSMRANIIPDLGFSPSHLEFRLGDDVSRSSRTVQFQAIADPACGVVAVNVTHRAFSALLAENRQSAVVTFDPSLWAAEETHAELVLKTTGARAGEVVVPLYVISKP